MKTKKLDQLVTTEMIKGKQPEKIMYGLTKRLNVCLVIDALKTTMDPHVWKVMIASHLSVEQLIN